MDKPARPHGPQADDRFTLHHRQPRADKLDNRQHFICRADHGNREALRMRVANPDRFDAFTRWPTGRLEVHFPNGTSTPGLPKAMDAKAIWQAAQRSPDLLEVLRWAGWY